MCSGDSTECNNKRTKASSDEMYSTEADPHKCSQPIDIIDASFPTQATYAEELSVSVTLRNYAGTEQSRRLELCGESHGVPVSLTEVTVYVPGNTTVEHELTALAAPAALSELFIVNTDQHSPVTVSPIQATVGDQISLPDGTILQPTTVEQAYDATALYIDVIKQGLDGPPHRFRFTEQTQDALAPELGEFDRACATWDPLYSNSETGGWLIFLPQTQTVFLRGEGQQAIIILNP